MAENPYAAPRSRVEDAPTSLPDGDFIPEGRGVPAGNGWRWIADAWAFMGEQRWTFIGVFLLLIVIADRCATSCRSSARSRSALFLPVILGGFVLGCDARAPRRAPRGRASVRRLSAAYRQAHRARRDLARVRHRRWRDHHGPHRRRVDLAAACSAAREPNPEEVMGMLLPMLLAVLVILALSLPCRWRCVRDAADRADGLGPRAGAEDELLRVPEEHPAVPRVERRDLRVGHRRVDPVVPRLVAARSRLMVSLYLAYRDIFHEL